MHDSRPGTAGLGKAGIGTASPWPMASRRRRVGVCEVGGELLELGRGRVALVAALERVEPAVAERLVELDEYGGEVGREPGGLGEDRHQLFVGQPDVLQVWLADRFADRRRD